MSRAEVATVTTLVAVDPATAFDVFTGEIGQWWKSGPRYRFDPEKNGTLRFEPCVGGRLVEVHDARAGQDSRSAACSYGSRGPGSCSSSAAATSPPASARRWRCASRRRGRARGSPWNIADGRAWPPAGPARHGYAGQAFADMIGLWWADLLVALQARAGR